METAGSVSFPVVFNDGEHDVDIGSVLVSSSTEFKNFQSILSKMIGISSNQFTVYLAEYKISLDSTAKIRRRIPITGKVNFGAISEEENSFFLVVLKRHRRERRRKVQENEGDYYFPSALKTKTKANQSKKKNLPENVMLLRRNAGMENELLSGFISPMVDHFEYEQRLRNLQLEKEKYLGSLRHSNLTVTSGEGGGGQNGKMRSGTAVCRYCLSAKETGIAAGFHCCAHDTVTTGFRSHAGAISRPVRESE